MRNTLIAAIAALLLAPAAHSQVNPAAFKWMPGPPGLPKGAEFTVLSGDPTKPGLFTIRLRMPSGYTIPPHQHPSTELVTVVSGQVAVGMGPTLDRAKAKTLVAGGFAEVPANMNHFAFTRGRTIIQITAQGPFGITYANAADQPRQ